ncbi:MAG: thiamine pyrophosphate-dependent dehydrogenase E1 component subunit alpha [Candidatus Caldatribacteriota bacterium]|nr:thiamine pyrophosphate-dependent dehydrogenase E1 component subunit alpha [Atribacterota bacterium]MDD3031734.1 thiamine pyrophosphate-dependent dehydrogenase E1 component subunit alpha [Atribacterota bacterium]MDD3640784.1 thiamine pyrophosphate-dependent dehydrogenase E1 component subunit alpha [Atribacterota bacterium]MDD4289153.1 thiamine pyrophosphate-dependent dehydrogenase E1 component subunit alpha [Atribacterota bacterium]MDD4765187.1 thiamine pyrophosphate-dependent dehydrogenase E
MDIEQEIRLFRTMVRIRTLEDILEKLFREGKLNGHLHTYHGQEAIAAGVMEALSEKDIIFSNHRNHGHFLARGTSPKSIISECYGRVTGTNRGRSGSMYLSDKKRGMAVASGVVGGNICVATGSALASQVKKDKAVTVSFFGDGATNIGFFHESLNMAAVWNLPIIYICENNHYGAATKKEEHQKIKRISERAAAYDMPGYTIDGTDVIKVYKKTKQVLEKVRNGGGPVLLEFLVYRLRGHSAGDLGNYRPEGEQNKWKEIHDPIKKYKKELLKMNTISSQEIKEIEEEVQEEINKAVDFAIKSDFPLSDTVTKNIYQEEEANE